MATAETLLTAEDFRLLPDSGQPMELVRGIPVSMNMLAPRHGEICGNIVFAFKEFLKACPRGRVVSNDSGVVTRRNPDSVRGADVAYYSYDRIPRGPLPDGYLAVSPDIVLEVLSPGDRLSKLITKVAEYLEAGVGRVCVVDPLQETTTVFCSDSPEEKLSTGDVLAFPGILPGFSVPVSDLLA